MIIESCHWILLYHLFLFCIVDFGGDAGKSLPAFFPLAQESGQALIPIIRLALPLISTAHFPTKNPRADFSAQGDSNIFSSPVQLFAAAYPLAIRMSLAHEHYIVQHDFDDGIRVNGGAERSFNYHQLVVNQGYHQLRITTRS